MKKYLILSSINALLLSTSLSASFNQADIYKEENSKTYRVVPVNNQKHEPQLELENKGSSQVSPQGLYILPPPEVVSGYAGLSVSGIGDFNGDEINDVIVGFPIYEPSGSGSSFIVYGQKGSFGSFLSLANITASQGVRIAGDSKEGGFSGYAVSGIGDFNGDTLDDVIIGDPVGNPNNMSQAGLIHIVYGKKGGYESPIFLGNMSINVGFPIYGAAAGGNAGSVVKGIGDFNVDGFNDVIIASQDSQGTAYILYGRLGGYTCPINLGDIPSNAGLSIAGVGGTFESPGNSVSGVGDMNGDGIQDIALGSTYVIYGKKGGYQSIDLSNFTNNMGFQITGTMHQERQWWAQASAGDINVDGIQDLIIGISGDNPNGLSEAGSSYIIYGKKGGYTFDINLGNLTSDLGFWLEGNITNGWAGYYVSGIGDFNGDSFDDVVIGAPSEFGMSYSYFIWGRPGGYSLPINLSNITSDIGLVLNDTLTHKSGFGHSVSGVGDFNGNGINDAIIGDPYAFSGENGTGQGYAYIAYGFKDNKVLQHPLLNSEVRKEVKEKQEVLPMHSREARKIPVVTDLHQEYDTPAAGSSSSLRPSWYSPVRWYEAVKAIWSSSSTQEPLSSEAETLVNLKDKCTELMEEVTDKSYAFNLKDLVRDIEETLEHPEAITLSTVKRFKGYLGDLNREYAREEWTSLSPYMQALLLGRTQAEAPMSFTTKAELGAIGSLPQAPMLGFRTVLPALGK